MNEIQFMLLYLLARIVIPFGSLLLLGEWMRRRDSHYWLK